MINGSMLSKSDATGYLVFGWDYENRMVSARKRNKIVRYQYDALGRRVSRIGKTLGSTKYTYDGQDVVMDDDFETGIVKYQNGPGIDNKLRAQSGASVNYFLADHLSSTNGLADSAGSLTSQTAYDSFGNATNSSFANRYQFTGREFDNFTGLHYYRARSYDANLGRFLSEDPIGFAGGDVNLYGYVGNDPQNWVDPSGEFPVSGWPTLPRGSVVATWLDESIGVAQDFYGVDPPVAWSPLTNPSEPIRLFDTLRGGSNMLRVGDGLGHALYAPDENIWGRAAYCAMDIERGAGLFTVLGGFGVRFAGSSTGTTLNSKLYEFSGREIKFNSDFRIAPFGNRNNHPYGKYPHYHRRGVDSNGDPIPGQGIGRHRPWETKSTDKRFRDRF